MDKWKCEKNENLNKMKIWKFEEKKWKFEKNANLKKMKIWKFEKNGFSNNIPLLQLLSTACSNETKSFEAATPLMEMMRREILDALKNQQLFFTQSVEYK